MKWMGGWSWLDLMATPPDVVTEIVRMINEEAEAIEARNL